MKKIAREVKALTFDVFGTVVDWRGSITAEGRKLGRRKKLALDWAAFADAWRAGYRRRWTTCARGGLPWTNIDGLHRRILDDLLARFGHRRPQRGGEGSAQPRLAPPRALARLGARA